jgi:hypothetical protein
MVCLEHYESLCKHDPSTPSSCASPTKASSNSSNSKYHQLTILYRYTLQELEAIYKTLKEQAEAYKNWCKKVELIVNLKYDSTNHQIKREFEFDKDTDTDIEEITEKCTQKPHLSLLVKLVEQARVNRYPRNKGFTLSVKSEKPEEIDIFEKLQYELKKAIECSKMCARFLDMYRKNINAISKKEGTNNTKSSYFFLYLNKIYCF